MANINMELEDELHRRFKVKAAMEGRKMNEVIVTLVTSYVSANSIEQPKEQP